MLVIGGIQVAVVVHGLYVFMATDLHDVSWRDVIVSKILDKEFPCAAMVRTEMA